MGELFEECLAANKKSKAIDSYDADDLKGCFNYDAWRLSRNKERDERRFVHRLLIS
jgi:hypothetical protein